MDLDNGTLQVVAIVVLAFLVMAALYLVEDTGRRIVCHTWKIRLDGDFEAETLSGTILFRRDDIHLIEPHESGNNSETWVCIGNFQRMVWIEFPDQEQASQFVHQMEHLLGNKRFERGGPG